MHTERNENSNHASGRWTFAQFLERLNTDGRLLVRRLRPANKKKTVSRQAAEPVPAAAAAVSAQSGRPVEMRAAARAVQPQEQQVPVTVSEKRSGPVGRKLRWIRRRWHQILREKRARRFPESNRLLIQWILLFWNMIPVWISRLKEHTWGHRKRSIHRKDRTRNWVASHKFMRPVAFLMLAGFVTAVTVFFSMYTYGTTVIYDGESIAAVKSPVAAQNARRNVETVTSRTLGTQFSIDSSLLQYSNGLLRRQDVVDTDTLVEDLSEEIGLVTYGYSLYVDGEFIGATPYEGALEELLQQLKNDVMTENTISCGFQEDVEIREGHISSDKIVNLGYLAETLYSTKTQEVTYTIQRGDTWIQIANNHDMTSAELLAMNPGYNIHKLSIGDVLTLSAAVPYLTLKVVQQERYVGNVPFDVEYTDTNTLYQGDYKVTSAGKYGSADVVANVTYVNGEEIAREVLSSTVLVNPVTEYRLRGTKERPSWYPTGTFRWPTTGNITSNFGYRKSPGGVGSTNHKGLDIANRYGTAIYAADGGKVTYAGWMSGYGYLVRIDHLNGYVSYYGHNSSLLVSNGQHVYKGQQIAKMGSTGVSTGNHCHFEIRYNGVPKNPLNYLS